jgi:hypothetical protein
MDPHADVHSPTPIRRLMAKAPTNVIKRGGLPREQALPSIRALAYSPGADPNAVTRAIKDLKRSGYRPLRPPSGGAAALVQPRRASGPTRHGVAGEADSMLKYLTGQTCAEGDGRSVIELEAVACQQRIPTG